MANADNPSRGANFEGVVRKFFEQQGLSLQPNFSVDVGVNSLRRPHKFDLGCAKPPTLLECKNHTWTEGGNAPAHKTRCLAQARAALAMPAPNPIAQDTAAAFMRRVARIEIECCPRCHGCWRPIAHAAPLRRSLWPRAGRPLTAAQPQAP